MTRIIDVHVYLPPTVPVPTSTVRPKYLLAHVFIAVATDDDNRRSDCGIEMQMELVLV